MKVTIVTSRIYHVLSLMMEDGTHTFEPRTRLEAEGKLNDKQAIDFLQKHYKDLHYEQARLIQPVLTGVETSSVTYTIKADRLDELLYQNCDDCTTV